MVVNNVGCRQENVTRNFVVNWRQLSFASRRDCTALELSRILREKLCEFFRHCLCECVEAEASLTQEWRGEAECCLGESWASALLRHCMVGY